VTRSRVAVALILVLFVGLPLAQPFLDLAGRPEAWDEWASPDRLLGLARNTALLVLGTLALALPTGTLAAVLLYRTDLPGRLLFRALNVAALFIPLPLLTAAWQAGLGTGGWLPLPFWEDSGGQPWPAGLGPAVCVHTMAAMPWVIVLVGRGLCCVEAELEEDALLAAGPWRVLWHVTLPRSAFAVAAAGLWVALQTAGEVTVASLMQLSTFAEDALTQMNLGREGQARAVAALTPAAVLLGGFLLWGLPRLQRAVPPAQSALAGQRLFTLGRGRRPWLLVLLLAATTWIGVPLASLVWKAGLHGTPRTWSLVVVLHQIGTAFRLNGVLVVESVFWAALAGVLAAGLALLLCWLAAESRWLQGLALAVAVLAWVLPGPVAGYGLKDVIAWLGHLAGWGPRDLLGRLLYYGPSPLPVVWAYLVRFFPYALAVLWPVVRLLPRELRDAARVDGATPARELGRVVVPLTRPALLAAALVTTALSLGEVSGSKPVSTPGMSTFSEVVFDRMHYGVTNEVAALCLVLLLLLGALAAALGVWPLLLRTPSAEFQEIDLPSGGL
jgi:iron(III) transport system permease protein